MPAAIVMPDADLSLAFPSILFSAVGTAGQRCTSTRRLYLHKSIAPIFLERLQAAYATIPIGDPLNSNTLIGPLHTRSAVKAHQDSIADIRASGGLILTGGNLYIHPQDELKNGNFVLPAVAVPNSSPSTAAAKEKVDRIWNQETFAPVLKVALFDELEEAIELNNSVPQGLSSSLWSNDVRNLGEWIGPNGSDAGIVNVRTTPLVNVLLFTSLNSSMQAPVARRLVQPLAGTRALDGMLFASTSILASIDIV